MQCARTSYNNLRIREYGLGLLRSLYFGFFGLFFLLAEMIVINHGFQFLFHGNPRKRGRIPPMIITAKITVIMIPYINLRKIASPSAVHITIHTHITLASNLFLKKFKKVTLADIDPSQHDNANSKPCHTCACFVSV